MYRLNACTLYTPSSTWYDVVWYGMVWYGMIWYGMVVWYGVVWYGMVWYGTVWYMVWYSRYTPCASPMAWYGMAWHGMAWYGGMVWYGMVCTCAPTLRSDLSYTCRTCRYRLMYSPSITDITCAPPSGTPWQPLPCPNIFRVF